jgi:competence protein ComEA
VSRALCTVALLLGFWGVTQANVSAEASAPLSCAESTREGARININTAGVDELVTLRGIGPSRAQAILDTRAKRAFRRVEDILRVHGIGRKTFRLLRDCIRVQ